MFRNMGSGILRILILLLCVSVSEAGVKQRYGVNSGLESDQIAEEARVLGVKWVRLTIYWNEVEAVKGQYDWTVPDAAIQRAQKNKLSVLAVLHGTPRWANGGRAPNYPPGNSANWARFVQAVAQRYKTVSVVRAYGIWNEPNLKEFWQGTRTKYLKRILAPAYRKIKNVNPNLIVVGPELSHHWILQAEWWLWDLPDSAFQSFDVLGLHYYPDAPVDFVSYMDDLVDPYRRGKQVWITEVGFEACTKRKCSEDQQSHAFFDFLQTQKKRAKWFRKIFPYRIWDPLDSCKKDGNGFGIMVGDNMDPRPAFRTYQDFIKRRRFHDPSPHCPHSSP